MGNLSDFERGQILSARLAGTSVIKTVKLLDVSREPVSKVMSAYTNQGKTTSAKRSSGRKSTDRKRSSHIQKDYFEKSQNYCSADDSRTEQSS
jgi:hypothetical protein